ncbi:FAD-dependent oxidoreductase [Deinococcus cellulosilyticus]|uniref:Oxidoreductase n=1 Tax=Deinococcus cellulosilyticus (strain DSM 18568 / NBRC 106333 / KACC 11606 / 5516J-15) TaxID=1223518 RepID=A0A511N678_DEIC1|nr:FAD-dependent oxidoreductase [Deinococcus cellulosilyticus]GEM48379.1 oxidoreductase [Deinococcus cellulosilyticus NBRC 106333 = KACC 11606]
MNEPTSQHPMPAGAAGVALRTDIVVIGAGQAGLSAAYHLKKQGVPPGKGFVVLDANPFPGGAWQHRWPTLTLSTVNRVHDLPGMRFTETTGEALSSVQARLAVPEYFAEYEKRFGLPVYRPVRVLQVTDRADHRLQVQTDQGPVSTRGIINATGTWNTPFIPDVPGRERFLGRQLHTQDYQNPHDFLGQHVLIVGGGISALQLLDEISQVTETTWVTRREPEFRKGPFDDEAGRAAVSLVEARVRAGLEPESVVSVTGLMWTPQVEAMQQRGVLSRLPMFQHITEKGVVWEDGRSLHVDVILWCTGFRSSLSHLSPVNLREDTGGITLTGRLATQVARDPRIHLVGHGPSASTIGANRAGRAAVQELCAFLGIT